jgi:hypothetical protein
VAGQPLDGGAWVVAVDPADDGVDAEIGEPAQLAEELCGPRAAVVGVEREGAGAFDPLEVGAGFVAVAAQDVELGGMSGPGRRLQASA